ncbi:MAG: ATP-binding protein [Chthoniobacterales bacterium]|nr:ATP-binding protein [Chthoniobacterales bacterium]
MKPWREIAIPHPDVLEGTFQQSEFAADITAVRKGKAGKEYGDAQAFFQRTFITEGMRLLLTQVAQRLNGKGGEPVIQLQTAFGGGKTHTLLAVYHLASRKCSIQDLPGVPDLLDKAGLMDVPQARIAVLDGTDLAPDIPRKMGGSTVNTLWGELAWQLGGESAFSLVGEADASGTSPGKSALVTLLEQHAPCVVLVDELVAYIRQFPESSQICGGTYDSNLSFVQALTEAAKLVPNAVILASLPESEIEVGSQRGVATLKALEKTFGRVQALWKPVATEEAFEIVRRRLFEPELRDPKMRETVSRAFADAYIGEGTRLPSETQEVQYFERLLRAYPIHPEVFDRLYEDWTTIDGFQRTRGVLKLMAKVIYRLWKDDNKDLLILPGSLPLYDGNTRNELTYYLPAGWDPVLEKDIDGDRAETTELESKEPRFGAIQAARRAARTLFLGTAPSSVATKPGVRGLDRARILLGCLQPGQTASVYTDALNRIADRLHYLNNSGDKAQDNTRFWFDTRANLRREMEDRKRRFEEKNEVRGKIADVLKKLASGIATFDGTHIFTPHSDVPDDSELRLVVLPPNNAYAKEETRMAFDAVLDYVRNNGGKPRYRGNRLVFLAADHGGLSRLNDSIRTALAWGSIVEDIKLTRLNIDLLQQKQAEKEFETATDVLARVARDCYKWLLCPVQYNATETKISVEAFALNTSGSSLGKEVERVTSENELVIPAWSPIHLRTKLKELYWKADKTAIRAFDFWEDTLRYLYLPRLRDNGVLAQAIVKGADTKDFFGTAYGQSGDTFDGFKLGDANIQFDDTLLLIEPQAARDYAAKQAPAPPSGGTIPSPTAPPVQETPPTTGTSTPVPPATPTTAKAKAFYGSADITPATAKVRLVQIAEEIISVLGNDPNANVKVTLEISADFPEGASDQTKRAVSENATALGFKTKDWE